MWKTSWSSKCTGVVSVFLGRERLTILRRMVTQQGRLPLTLVGVGVDIIYKTEGDRQRGGKQE